MGREEVLRRVREAEDRVSQMLEEAKRESEARLSRARREADGLVRDGLAAVDREAEAVFHKAREDTRAKVDSIMGEGRGRIDAARRASEARLPTAVDRLVDDFKRSILNP